MRKLLLIHLNTGGLDTVKNTLQQMEKEKPLD